MAKGRTRGRRIPKPRITQPGSRKAPKGARVGNNAKKNRATRPVNVSSARRRAGARTIKGIPRGASPGGPKKKPTSVAELRRKAGARTIKGGRPVGASPGGPRTAKPKKPISVSQLRREAGARTFRGRPVGASPRPGAKRTGSTGRPPIDPGQQLRNFMNNMPRPRVGGPQAGINLANRAIALPRARGGRAAARAAGDPRSFMSPRQAEQFNRSRGMGIDRSRGMGNVPQRPIPNRDGRMAELQAAVERQRAAARGSLMGSMGQGMRGPQGPRPMPPSNYMRQPMPPQQIQRGMGRGPMGRGNIGQVQAPRPTFGQQMRGPRARIIPRRP